MDKIKLKKFKNSTIGKSKSTNALVDKVNMANSELEDMLKAPYVGHDKLMTLIRRYKLAKDPIKKDQLRDEIFRNNIRFIRKAVMRKVQANFPNQVEDAFNAAVVSFLEGLDKFKPNRGYKFQTYIGFWINKAIYQEYVGRNIVNIPRGNFFNKTANDVMVAKNIALVYLDQPLGEGGRREESSMNKYDLIEDKFATAENNELEIRSDEVDAIKRAMDAILEPFEHTMLYWKYFCNPALSFDEVAKLASCSRERARQIIFTSIYKIKRQIETNGNFVTARNKHSKIATALNISAEQMKSMYDETIKNRRKSEIHSESD